jgi:hypothetical protein
MNIGRSSMVKFFVILPRHKKTNSAGFTGIAAWWLENGMPISAEQASQQITRDILLGYLRLMGSRYHTQENHA